MDRLLPPAINVLVAFYQERGRVRHASMPVTSVSYNNGAFQEVFCMRIREDNLDGPEIAEMLREHIRNAHEHSPGQSAHTMDLHELRSPEITFWTVWQEQDLLGCGALKVLDTKHGELKSMWTGTAHRGKGVGSSMLRHIIKEAQSRCYSCLSLETGSMDAFAAARALYARFGYEYQGPFADYREDPQSVFMSLIL